jgi:hypothetical protein
MKTSKDIIKYTKFSRPLFLITFLGILTRIIYWAIYPLNWKLHASFNVFEMGVIPYLSNFSGYKPGRMPFFDAFSAAFYLPFSNLLGAKALVVFNIFVTSAAIPIFYFAVKRLFSSNIAIPATILFALYPKYIVLTSTGLPEAASVSFLVLGLYAFATGRNTGILTHYGVSGVFITLSFLMFVPAVAAGMLLAASIYFSGVRCQRKQNVWPRRLLPDKKLLSFSVVPGCVGLLYLLFGPASRIAEGLSEGSLSVFSNPGAYSILEKTFWYLSYNFFDFWWHTRGFDRERGIRALVESLQGFFTSIFPLYLLGWTGITLTFSGLIFVGIGVFIRRRQSVDILFISWIFVYVVLFNYKNLGWVGGFQTRHIFPIFPALCIAFGVGVCEIQKIYQDTDLPISEWVHRWTVVLFILVLGLSVLFVNGAVQGAIENQKHEQDTVEPTQEITQIVGNDSVAVVWPRNQRNIMLYSENKIRPVILAGSQEQESALNARHGKTSTRQLVSNPLLCDADVEYLYLHIESSIIDRFPYTIDLNESRINQLLKTHEVIYEKNISESPFRRTSPDIYLLRLECTNTEDDTRIY